MNIKYYNCNMIYPSYDNNYNNKYLKYNTDWCKR